MNQFGTWDFVSVDTLEVLALELTGKSVFCCTQKQERGQTAPYQDKWLMTEVVINLMSCEPTSDARCLFFASKLCALETSLYILPLDFFLCFAGFL